MPIDSPFAPGDQVFEAIFGTGDGPAIRSALMILQLVGQEPFRKAVLELDRTISFGPMRDPTAYLDGRRFKNAAEWIKIAEAARALVALLPPIERIQPTKVSGR